MSETPQLTPNLLRAPRKRLSFSQYMGTSSQPAEKTHFDRWNKQFWTFCVLQWQRRLTSKLRASPFKSYSFTNDGPVRWPYNCCIHGGGVPPGSNLPLGNESPLLYLGIDLLWRLRKNRGTVPDHHTMGGSNPPTPHAFPPKEHIEWLQSTTWSRGCCHDMHQRRCVHNCCIESEGRGHGPLRLNVPSVPILPEMRIENLPEGGLDQTFPG